MDFDGDPSVTPATEISLQENSVWQIELVWAAAGGTKWGPPRAGHVIHPHDPAVEGIHHEDLPSADEDAERTAELVWAVAEGTELGPPRAGHGLHPSHAVGVGIRTAGRTGAY